MLGDISCISYFKIRVKNKDMVIKPVTSEGG